MTELTTKKSWQNWVSIIILFGFVGLLGINYYGYLQFAELKNKVAEQSNYNTKTDQLLELNTVDNKLLNNDVITLKNALTTLESSLAELLENKKNPDLKIKRLAIENLINAANVKLKLDSDLKASLAILNIADEYLKEDTNPDLINLRKKILNKISQLEQVKLPDLVKTTADLEQFIVKIDNMTIIDLMQNKLTTNVKIDDVLQSSTDTRKDANWQQILDNVRKDLFNLVRIRKIDDKDSAQIIKLLDDQQINILKLYFKLKTTQAIISLQQRNLNLFTSSLNDLEKNINYYFVNNEQLRLTLLGLIKNNKDIDLIPQVPDLSDLYPAIKIVKGN